jgi:glycosyltransferase involved in cell wall biosynthesis
MLNHRLLMTTDAVGGVWRYSLDLAEGLSRAGMSIRLTVLGPGPDAAQRAEAAEIPHLTLHRTGLPLDWTAETPGELNEAAQVLARLTGRMQVDSVHLHSPALLGSATWPAPVVAVAHSCVGTWWDAVRGGRLPPDLAWRATAMANGLAGADAVVAPSASFAAALRARYGLRRRIHVIPNGRRPMPASAAQRSGVLTAGRLWDPGKAAATLDTVAALFGIPIRAAGPPVDPFGQQVELPHLHHLGSLDASRMAQAYAEAAIFASVGRYEPFGLAVLEAAQAGCALVLSNIPTFRELWHDAALFVPPDDAEATAAALTRLLGDPAACAHLGHAARQAARRFDPARMAEATQALHAMVLAREAA